MSEKCWKCKAYTSTFRQCNKCNFSACDKCWHYSSTCPECHSSDTEKVST